MAETLMDAFDYRTWFAFTLHERIGSSRVRLTKRRHAVGSGGEQSVLIHLPLFAAAAALYGDSEAPRLISVLDEALQASTTRPASGCSKRPSPSTWTW